MVKKIVKEIEKLSGNYSGYEIFSDRIKCMALTTSNSCELFHGSIWKKREKEYLDIVHKHGIDKIKVFAEMHGMLAIAMENEMEDILGKIYMEAGLGSKQTGQFFTPFHVSYMCAKMAVPQNLPDKKIRINEPSSGGGGMIIATAKVLKERGINYQEKMEVVAQDLDWKGVYMTYVQLSLLGINAAVVQGDTLAEPYKEAYPKERVFYTPAKKGMIF